MLMINPRRILLIAAVTLLLGLAALELPHAKRLSIDPVVIAMTTPELAAEADAVVEGTVQRRLGTVRETDASGSEMVYTRWLVRPERVDKGAPGSAVVLRTLGGQYLSTIVEVDDQPTLEAGERALLFLKHIPEWKGDYRAVGEFQGKFRLEGDSAIQSESVVRQPLAELRALVGKPAD